MTRDESDPRPASTELAGPELALTVRRASADEPDEADAIARLINRAYQIEKFFVDGERTNGDEVRELSSHGSFLVLDYQSGGLAAVVYLRIAEHAEDARECSAAEAYFGMLAVDPALQGMGLGLRLVSVAEALAEARGCTAMDIHVINLRSELPPWYRSLGYSDCGTSPFPAVEKLKRPCHVICMRKQLGTAAQRIAVG